MADDGKIVGVQLHIETIRNWINEIKTKTEPSIIPDTEQIEYERKEIVKLSIQEFPVHKIMKFHDH